MAFQNPLSIAVAVTVKQRRSELRMTREELAETMGVPLEIVIDIEESNENECLSSKSTMLLLALALKLPHNALVAYLDNQQSEVECAEKVIGDRQQFEEFPAKEQKFSRPAGNPHDAHDDLPTPSSDSSPAQVVPKQMCIRDSLFRLLRYHIRCWQN